MTMRAAVDGLRKYYLSRSELVLRSLPRYTEPNQFEQAYNEYLIGIKKSRIYTNRSNDDLLSFPLKSFKKFPKSTIDKLIKSSYEVIKENWKMNTPFFYNSVLRSFISHDIECDVTSILKDMTNNNVRFNNDTYTLLINLYSYRGDMAAVENLINTMKNNELSLLKKSKYHIYGGYIRMGQFDEAEKFMKEENLDEDDILLFIQKAKAYADIGNLSEVMDAVKNIGKIDENIPSKISTYLYLRMVKSKASDAELNQVLEILNTPTDINAITYLLFLLNRDGFYNHSLKLMLEFKDKLVNTNDISNLISSFNNMDCPINTYTTVLENFLGRIYPDAYMTLFANMTLDDAFKLSLKIMTTSNAQCLFSNLLMKAVKEKNVGKIQEILQVAVERLPTKNLNTIVQYVLLPAMLDNEIIGTPQQILKLLPQQKGLILPNLFIHFLCKGDFSSFQALLTQHHFNAPLNYINFSRSNAKNIMDNVPFKEIDKVAIEASKVFSHQFVNWLIGSVIGEKIIQLSKVDNVAGIEDAVNVAKSLGTTFEKKHLEYIKNSSSKHYHLIEGLVVGGDGTEREPDEALVEESTNSAPV